MVFIVNTLFYLLEWIKNIKNEDIIPKPQNFWQLFPTECHVNSLMLVLSVVFLSGDLKTKQKTYNLKARIKIYYIK